MAAPRNSRKYHPRKSGPGLKGEGTSMPDPWSKLTPGLSDSCPNSDAPIPVVLRVPVGYECAVSIFQPRRQWWSDTLLKYNLIKEPLEDEVEEVVIPKEEEEPYDSGDEYVKTLDPLEWKTQDHYRIMGLKHKRYRASEDDIRKAYRKKLLLHHPDKRGVIDAEGDYFACITKAIETLGDPVKRRSYDSVDPTFDNVIPEKLGKKQNFFTTFGPVFERNAHWSTKPNVPLLGYENSTRSNVESFYGFWYEFDSWREYSYEDEEDKEKGADRDERRWIEKENRAVRQKKKKEEMARIRQLVDLAYNLDPRIQMFKEQEKKKREEEKRKKVEARESAKFEEAKRQQEQREADMMAKQKEEEEARLKRESERKEKDVVKKQKKRAKKMVESQLERCNFFQSETYNKVQALTDFDKMCSCLSTMELEELGNQMEGEPEGFRRRDMYFTQLWKVEGTSAPYDNGKLYVDQGRPNEFGVDQNSNIKSNGVSSKKEWSVDDVYLLTKATKTFPPGTQNRWDVITEYFNQHSTSGYTRKVKDVMGKSKELLDPNAAVRAASNAAATQKVFKMAETVEMDAAPSIKDDSGDSWTLEEQRMLEQALITFPKETPKRWDRIAEAISTRTKDQCIRRYKELASLVRAKKEAIQAVQSRKH